VTFEGKPERTDAPNYSKSGGRDVHTHLPWQPAYRFGRTLSSVIASLNGITTFTINLVGDDLRDALDPRMKRWMARVY